MPFFDVDINAFNAGERKTFDGVYRYYSRPLQHFAFSYMHNRVLAEEIVSDSMLKLWNNRQRIRTAQQIKAFLYIATRNACIDSLRSIRSLPATVLPEEANDLKGQDPDVYNRIVYVELLQQIEDAVEGLPLSQQAVFRKSFLEGKTTDEIASETGMTESSIFTQKSKALSTLRKLLKGNILLLVLLAKLG
ncbi:RNA polymerase sigma factor [Olivibacter domesticus]|uniref:RNA polymerase sigma-70 factor, ECF subfamily n=1 Tax=Olivibacter domesticus TaxID=407022 RepID=A0A1H7R631_OLID1|nr:sigma-70 family RNA polymerase sigma factor [Olivibacter domesticus]SEL55671.1 RNA polymerase sigma-70 factor, ECF subfamily [Olivibacter domesticus]